MTQIFAAACVDGVAVIADTMLFRRKGDVTFGVKKIDESDDGNFLIAAAGMDATCKLLQTELNKLKFDLDLPFAHQGFRAKARQVADSVNAFVQVTNEQPFACYPRQDREASALLAYRGDSRYELMVVGAREPRGDLPFTIVGIENRWANLVAKRAFPTSPTMMQAAIFAWFALKQIEIIDPDGRVGIGTGAPDVWFAPHGSHAREATEDERGAILTRAQAISSKSETLLSALLTEFSDVAVA